MVIVTEEMVLEKERQNAARREALNKRSQKLSHVTEPDPNFPPECCCVKPIIYHNIREQVPVPQQRFMYILAGLYITLMVLIVYNIVAALVAFILGGNVTHFGLSFLFLLGIPGAWIAWYYNVYCAIVYSSRPRQKLALLGLFLGVAFDVWMAVGVTGFGGCGWLYAFSLMRTVTSFVMILISAILWSLHGFALCVVMLRYWRVSGTLLRHRENIYGQSIV
ncbi:membrane-trafficking protein, putative [Leishmania panamensis]|uniref:Membrane-trafficking protein, putative n=2 Tax=Leishmania guyanensis species complex TaxID=38579 RepID=A0A088S103_LEIPA|nr:membrane-trafficking protein, putative [Leishmania panamensis]AIO02083.1 membrane-trafficking protein, putative [Leishmania panamensis]